MIKKYIMILPLLLLTSCGGKVEESPEVAASELQADTVSTPQVDDEVPTETKPRLECDTTLQNPVVRCASMVDESASSKILTKLDSLMTSDMSDLRQKCKQVFYPFSGPDFLYPFTLFPEADSYVLMGLEKTGSPITNEVLSRELGSTYAKTLKIYLRSSFFRTLSMKEDLDSETIDGVVPVITMLMAKRDCQIISIGYKKIDENGLLQPTEMPARCVEIRFFQECTPYHEQVLYFFSGNVANNALSKRLETFLNGYLHEEQCVCFLKAASYVMHKSYFSRIRNIAQQNAMAVLQDDSGIPYRFFPEEEWDNTLYGRYIKPVDIFSEICIQPDLDSLYKVRPVRKLGFRIGYNNPSNWMCARKKHNVQ